MSEGTPPNKGTKRLSSSASNQRHIEALAKKIKEDPAFPLLHETARKMAEKHGKLQEGAAAPEAPGAEP